MTNFKKLGYSEPAVTGRPLVYTPAGEFYSIRFPSWELHFVRNDGGRQDVVLAALWAHHDKLKIDHRVCVVLETLADNGSAPAADKICIATTAHIVWERAGLPNGRERMELLHDGQSDPTVRHG